MAKKALLLTGTVLVLAVVVFMLLGSSTTNVAMSLFSDTEQVCAQTIADYHDIDELANIHLSSVDLDSDGRDDYIAELRDAESCGSGGCLYELCKTNEGGGVEHIPFGYAAHTVEVQNTLTNGQRNIRVNGDDALIMQWNGTSYELTN